MLARADFLSLNFVKKEDYTGAVTGECAICCIRREVEEEKKLQIYLWPEPFCFDVTPEEQKISEMFPFSEDGLAQGIDWMNEQYESVRRHEK